MDIEMKSHVLKYLMSGVMLSLLGIAHAQSHVEHPELVPSAKENSRTLMMKPEDFPKGQTKIPKKIQKYARVESKPRLVQSIRKSKHRNQLASKKRLNHNGHKHSTTVAPCAPIKPVVDVCSMPK